MPSTPPSPARIVRFDVFELDLRSGELTSNGRRQTLPEQPLALLKALLERPGELVTRDELRHQLWPDDTFVDFEHGLNAAVKRLRDVLGDSAEAPRFIETVPRRGYRFVALVDGDWQPAPVVGVPEPVASPLPAPRPRRWWWAASAALLVVAATSAGAWWALHYAHTGNEVERSGAPVQRNLTRLTFDPGLQTDVTWAPDGRFIAYTSDKAGNFDIWVQPVTGGDAVQVTKSPAQDTEPDWSPDGSTIAFRSERDGGGLFVVSSLGGPERRLTSFGVRPKWSPDGSQLLFASSGEHILSRATYLVALDGSPAHRVLESLVNDDLCCVCCRAWHPDGRRVSILGRTRSQGIVMVTASLDGGSPVVTKLNPLESDDAPNIVQFQWAPSGAALVFEGRLNYVSNVWRITIDPQSLQAGSLERLTTSSGNDRWVAFSHDGKYAAFTTQADSLRMWLFPLDAAGRITGASRPVTEATAAVRSAALAPDGHRMAYSLDNVGSHTWGLWIEDLLTGDKRQLARDQVGRDVPSWSPDGKRLAYLWARETGTAQQRTIAVRPAAGGDEQLLADPLNANVVPFGWSPDGRSLLVSSNLSTLSTGRRMAVALWPLAAAPHADKAERVVAFHPDYDLWQESFSPSGRWIVFEAVNRRLADATATLYLIPSAGAPATEWTRLTDPHAWADKPRWSADGKLLYFWLRQGSFFNVWALRFDDTHGTGVGAPFQVTHFDGRARQINSTDLGTSEQSVSRTSILLPLTDTSGSIWMLDNADR